MTRVGTSEAAGPSRTAMIAAMARASHLLHYGPRALLADWLAWPLAGADAEAILAKRREGAERFSRGLRIAMRRDSRFDGLDIDE